MKSNEGKKKSCRKTQRLCHTIGAFPPDYYLFFALSTHDDDDDDDGGESESSFAEVIARRHGPGSAGQPGGSIDVRLGRPPGRGAGGFSRVVGVV